MALVINSNIQSLNAQRNLTISQGDQNQAMERLTSGKRINSAADDAAGLAISSRMTSQIRGLDQAVRNANDGISLMQTAEGALEESTNILQRMRELALQSANGIFSDGDRGTLDAEVQQLVAELDRISETTSFNGQNILDGSLTNVDLQVGSEANQTISFGIGATDTSTLGLGSTSADLSGDRITTGATADIGAGDILINGQALQSITNLELGGATDTNLQDVLDDINSNVSGVTAEGFNVVEATTVGTGVLTATDSLRLTLGSVDGGNDVNYDISGTTSMADLVSKINVSTGGNIEASLNDNGALVLSNTTGGTITVSLDTSATLGAFDGADTDPATLIGISDAGANGEAFAGNIALKSDDGSAITVTKGANGTDEQLNFLGFKGEITGAGQLQGDDLASGVQDDVLVANDVIINGVDIGAVSSTTGLTGKIDAINAVSDDTGVTATINAENSYGIDAAATNTFVELVTTAAGLTTIASGGTLTVNGVDVTAIADGDTATDMASAINDFTSAHGVTAYVDDTDHLHLASSSPIILSDTGGTLVAELLLQQEGATTAVGDDSSQSVAAPAGAGSIKINNQTVSLTDLSDQDQIVSELNAAQGVTGVSATIDENGELQLSSGSTITLEVGDTRGLTTANILGITFADAGDDGSLANDTVTIDPRISLDSANDTPISVQVTTAGETATGLSNLNTDLSATVTGTALSSISVATAAQAQNAIDSIDNALDTINDTRSNLGAVTNRLDFTINNLSSISQNTSAARSRIEDADFAAESASLSRAQVLQQAGTAMLAQANAQPQQVLSLLQ